MTKRIPVMGTIGWSKPKGNAGALHSCLHPQIYLQGILLRDFKWHLMKQ